MCDPCRQCVRQALSRTRSCSRGGEGFAFACRYRAHSSLTRFGCRRIDYAVGLVERLARPKPVRRSLAKEANDGAREIQLGRYPLGFRHDTSSGGRRSDRASDLACSLRDVLAETSCNALLPS